MKILALSDKIVPFIYSQQVRRRFQGVDLVIGCGDLSYYYLEYAMEILNIPLYFVRGNHDHLVEYGSDGQQRTHPHGGEDLHARRFNHKGLLLAGVEGSLRYRPGAFQHSQEEMWGYAIRLLPGLMFNRLVYGRYLDIFVTHAPPSGVHDQPDLPHQGIRAFRWLIDVFQPACHIHGHVHYYRPDEVVEIQIGKTRVINSYGFREIILP